MTEQPKLSRYHGKDYSEIVEFPVELVDRDGVVRLYSYEESLRVYLRRIVSAPWRYEDDSLVAAEVAHCNKRIDQLRRSYLLRCKTVGARLASERQTAEQCVLGEGLALLDEHFGEPDDGLPLAETGEPRLEIVAIDEEGPPAVYQVTQPPDSSLFLLYVFPREHEDAEESFEASRRTFEQVSRSSASVSEQLVTARRGEVAFFLLTRRAGLADERRDDDAERERALLGTASEAFAGPDDWEAVGPLGEGALPGPGASEFATGLAALRRRDTDQAIRHFKQVVECNPYHREAYLALSTLLDMVGDVDEGALYSSMAVAHLPGDGLVRFNQGLNLLRQGRRDDALSAFETAAELDDGLYQPRYFAGLIHAVGDRLARAAIELAAARERTRGERDRVDAALRWVRRHRRVRLALLGGAAGAVLSCALTLWWSPLLALGFAVVAVTLLLSHPLQARMARRSLARVIDTRGAAVEAGRPVRRGSALS